MVNVTGFANFVDNSKGNLPDVHINTSGVFSEMWKSMPPELINKISLLLDIGKWVLAAFLVYLLLKIIFQLIKLRDSSNLASIATNTKEINSKIDEILHKKKNEKK